MKDLKTKSGKSQQAQSNSQQGKLAKSNINPQNPTNTQSVQPSIIEDIFKTVKK